MALHLSSGQLAATSGTLLGAGTGERYVALILSNTSPVTQTIILTVRRADDSASRRIVRLVLKESQYACVRGVPLDPSDLLAGYATGASAVDYVISQTTAEPFAVSVYEDTGAPKAPSEIELEVTEKFGLTRDGIVLSGLLEQVRDLLLKIAP